MASEKIQDYDYTLPPERIALFPLEERDQSKLLHYANGKISHQQFRDLPSLLPENAFLFFNNTRVIPARLFFVKSTGAIIETFLLSPVLPSPVVPIAMETKTSCTWKCAVGNAKRWEEHTVLEKELEDDVLRATLLDKAAGLVRFEWSSNRSFAEVVERSGETPLPPYLKRKAEAEDKERYQTIYSANSGAVAAPTAGLHFTDRVFEELKRKNIGIDFLTLHVSAGTFQPIKTDDIREHTMHREQIVVSKKNIDSLLSDNKTWIPVGTTSMRTLESLYWYGVMLLENPDAPFSIPQDEPYRERALPVAREAFLAVQQKIERSGQESITGETSIYIRPGYDFKVCDGIVTNFHQPGSTLIVLVSTLIGDDWRRVYQEALDNQYRFLSYGDSSLLMRSPRDAR